MGICSGVFVQEYTMGICSGVFARQCMLLLSLSRCAGLQLQVKPGYRGVVMRDMRFYNLGTPWHRSRSSLPRNRL